MKKTSGKLILMPWDLAAVADGGAFDGFLRRLGEMPDDAPDPAFLQTAYQLVDELMPYDRRTPETQRRLVRALYAFSNHPAGAYRRAFPKKDGGYRVLHVPQPLLAEIQRRILDRFLYRNGLLHELSVRRCQG